MGKKTGSAGRFGVRYGKTIRTKVVQIENKQRKKQVCPYCKKSAVRRVAKGIFKCKKCNNKFAGGAYFI